MRVIISGGGTGGHIFPAIAIANALREIDKNTEILFVGAHGRMEMDKVPAAGYKIEGLWISGLQRRFTLNNLSFPFKVIMSLIKSRKIIKTFKPNVVVGTGGYASGPVLFIASVMGVPTLIQEQNFFPGITNKFLAKHVSKICVAYDGMEKYFPRQKIVVTGNPVRKDILSLEGKKDKGLKLFGLNPDKKTLLVVGGSLGARTINETMAMCLETILKNNIQVIWQTGKNYSYSGKVKEGVWVGAFIAEMDLAYACADLVVSRAGAIAISELATVKKPCILIPSPNVAEDHQTRNAMMLVKHKAAVLVKDSEAKEKLGDQIISLMNDEVMKKKLSGNISLHAHPNAAKVIAEEVIRLTSR